MPTKDYELVDFGDEEKLERFGDYLVRRPNLYAHKPRRSPELWDNADLVFRTGQGGDRGEWSGRAHQAILEHKDENANAAWSVKISGGSFHLKPTPVGHLGVFPEQQMNWAWFTQHIQPIAEKRKEAGKEPLKALNLFAYTGGSTIALAKSGVEVVHLDGAANTVKWARRNADLNDVTKGVRWIAEDALRFVHREIKRENDYDILVADPPSFGRGPKKEQWRIARDMSLLFDAIVELMPSPIAIIFSCHTEGFGRVQMGEMLRERLLRYDTRPAGELEQLKLQLTASDGRQLDAGECARWIGGDQ